MRRYLFESFDEFVGVNGLAECHQGTLAPSLSEQLRRFAGYDDDRRLWKQRSQGHDELQPIDIRHMKIRDDDIDAPFQVDLQGLLAIRGEIDVVTRSLRDVSEDDAIRLIVFDDEYTCHDTAPWFGPPGGRAAW